LFVLGCQLYAYFSGAFALMSVYQPALMAVEWCSVVIRPFIANRISIKHRLIGVFISAFIANCLTVPPLIGVSAPYNMTEHSQFCWYCKLKINILIY
jgi:hypothetical protein